MAASTTTPTAVPQQIYTVAVLLALFSLLILLLIIPPLFWHFRNRNIGATSLVTWTIVLLFFTFVNAVVWPSDDLSNSFSGIGLCDIEVRVQIASSVALPASFAAVLRGLAAVLDTDHATLVKNKAQKRRSYAIDLLFVVGAPLLQVVFLEILHYRRFAVVGISGCTPVVHDSWPTALFLTLPALLWTLVDGVYAVLILIRLYRYRLTFNSILASSNTTKSRFLRLYIICLVWICGFIPVGVYLILQNAIVAKEPFSWSETHDHAAYNEVFIVPSNGAVRFDRWIWLVTGFCVFVFFGIGREAVNMYRTGLLAMGLGYVFPDLNRGQRRPTVSTISSISSKARMILKRKTAASDVTWISHSTSSRPSSDAHEPVSPKTTTFLEAIREVSPERDAEKATPGQKKASFVGRLTAVWPIAVPAARKSSFPSLPIFQLADQNVRGHSSVSAGQRPDSLVLHVRDTDHDILVRKEVRQSSEHEKI